MPTTKSCLSRRTVSSLPLRQEENSSSAWFILSDCSQTDIIPRQNAPWGLGRLSAETPLQNKDARSRTFTYTSPESGGQGVTAYIIDTGIRVTHVRCKPFHSFHAFAKPMIPERVHWSCFHPHRQQSTRNGRSCWPWNPRRVSPFCLSPLYLC